MSTSNHVKGGESQGTKPLPPTDISGIVNLIDHHRAEIDKNFETVVAMLNLQKEQHGPQADCSDRINHFLRIDPGLD